MNFTSQNSFFKLNIGNTSGSSDSPPPPNRPRTLSINDTISSHVQFFDGKNKNKNHFLHSKQMLNYLTFDYKKKKKMAK